MGYIWSELEQNSGIIVSDWQSIAVQLLKTATQTNDDLSTPHPTIEKNQVVELAKKIGWNSEKINILESQFEKRNLSNISVWHGYATSHPNRMNKEQTNEKFNKFLEQIEKVDGQIHPWFKINHLFVYGSYARPFNEKRGCSDIDFMASIEWTGPNSFSGQEKIEKWNNFLKEEKPFDGRISIGFLREYVSTAKSALKEEPEQRKWQTIKVWQSETPLIKQNYTKEKKSHWDEWFEQPTEETKEILEKISDQTIQMKNKEEREFILKFSSNKEENKTDVGNTKKINATFLERRLKLVENLNKQEFIKPNEKQTLKS